MTSTKRDIRAPKCDACLWSPTDCKVVSAAVASVTCLHCFCVQCIRGLIQMAQKRKDKEKTLWFRCPAGPCGILIQSNQLRELSSKNLPTPLQYLFKSHNANKAIASLQKAASFHLEANSGWVKSSLLENNNIHCHCQSMSSYQTIYNSWFSEWSWKISCYGSGHRDVTT